MIASLLRPEAYDHPAGEIRLIETHISWVLLSGAYAYKIKKPVDLGFVDFTTPERRRWYCREELRLNRRLAPDLYLGLRPVRGPAERASFRGDGPPIELALQMRRFPQDDLLPAALARGALTPGLLEQLADALARFHAAAAVAGPDTPHGSPEAVCAPVFANLDVLQAQAAPAAVVARLRRWSEAEAEGLRPVFAARKAAGAIREGHGDLHLGNMVLHGGRIEVFDCLEFSEALRWIDPVSDLAFLAMDLARRGHPGAACTVLNRWLATGGDYPGLRTWRWYLLYRALVRAKVATLRLAQGGGRGGGGDGLRRERDGYLAWAEATRRSPAGALVITHGVSGSGKSHLARELCRRLGWIHLRSDVERLRLFGRWGCPARASFCGDPYRPEVSEHLYGERLPACAGAALAGGLAVLVDATFLRRHQRRRMGELAGACGVPFLILDCSCPPDLARRRIAARRSAGGDPSEADGAVLEAQLRDREPLGAHEETHAMGVGPREAGDPDRLA
ncbi:MAG: AAA family ATPase, partial [Synechococcaceae cyanobacterium]|nr:AAA family ATPase [Synechococcaceae cyanobacterium]